MSPGTMCYLLSAEGHHTIYDTCYEEEATAENAAHTWT